MAHSIFNFLQPGEVDFRPTVLSGCAPKSSGTHASGVLVSLIEACRWYRSLHSFSDGTGFAGVVRQFDVR
ncbi:MAG TPA: hypothetical protein VN476_10620 [Pyrinomonadaceae bacterium]|nr:hypothetical protein [Pyrinomonadaceae bacterium]